MKKGREHNVRGLYFLHPVVRRYATRSHFETCPWTNVHGYDHGVAMRRSAGVALGNDH
jgi:hypothetical protein